jgi:hypothetical protein
MGDGAQRTSSYPETLLRVGLTKRVEARVGVPNWTIARADGQTASGFGDLYLGTKIQLGPLPWGFDASIIPAITIPMGANRISSNRVDPEVKLTWAHGISEKWAVSGMFAAYLPTINGQHIFTWQPTISFVRVLTDRLETFFEYSGEFPKDGPSRQVFHHGLIYSLTPRNQLDVHYGVGLTRETPDFFIAFGYTFRIDALRTAGQRLKAKHYKEKKH